MQKKSYKATSKAYIQVQSTNNIVKYNNKRRYDIAFITKK